MLHGAMPVSLARKDQRVCQIPQEKKILPGCTAPVSGKYVLVKCVAPKSASPIVSAELRLDVDGWYPQNVLSLHLVTSRKKTSTYIAKITSAGHGKLSGQKIALFGTKAKLTRAFNLSLLVDVSGEVLSVLKFTDAKNGRWALHFKLVSAYFHEVQIEFDRLGGVSPAVTYDTFAHPVRPELLAGERIDLASVLNRAGISVTRSADPSVIPSSLAGTDEAWSRRELHDAMQTYWAHYSKKPQWSLWTLFATRFAKDSSIAGIMFDTLDKAQRRGMAIFTDAMPFNPPPAEGAKKAWKQRMLFFTLCHEVGHLLNLAHSGDKRKGDGWLELSDNPDALSFMNNPLLYDNGDSAFFREFGFRFDDPELLYIRHAPDDYVQMGNGAWFENHALSGRRKNDGGECSLTLESGRNKNRYAFMEPVVVECSLKNTSSLPLTTDFTCATLQDRISVSVYNVQTKKTVQLRPYCTCEVSGKPGSLNPGDEMLTSLFVSSDARGWHIHEPGEYILAARIVFSGITVRSNPLSIIVTAPKGCGLERLAQDYFTIDVGRVYAFDGSTVLDGANQVLAACTGQQMPRALAAHAEVALAMPRRRYKKLNIGDANNHKKACAGVVSTGCHADAVGALKKTLLSDPVAVSGFLGMIDYKFYVDEYTDLLIDEGDMRAAISAQKLLRSLLRQKTGRGRMLLKSVEARLRELLPT